MAVGKNILSQLFHRSSEVSDYLTFNRAKAIKWQEKTLKKLLFKARNTEFGIQHGFEEILISKHTEMVFRQKVSINTYKSMHPWWQREFNGEQNITWPGSVPYFALSSGTTEGSSKYIPVTADGLRAILKASRRQLFAIFKTDVPKDFFTKDYLMVGGSTNLNYNGFNYSGDLSGITTANVPQWFDRFALPEDDIMQETNWNVKLQKMVESASSWDIVMIAGAPSWIKILLENILKHYNLDNIHQIWPNLSVYSWGAVSLSPYKHQIDSMMGQPIKYFETYLASEGFFSFQTKPDSDGMRLVFRNRTYYEFIPFNESNFNADGEVNPNAEIVDLSEVVEGVDYALLITNCSGAWRYLVGDTIRFVNVDYCEIKITGRTKQFLSICGEHLCVDNMNEAISKLCESEGIQIPEYTVKGLKENGIYGHHWYLACDIALDTEAIKQKLDAILCELNDDYAVERKHALKEMYVEVYPESVFMKWMEKNNKLGGQSKFPRVFPDNIYEDWKTFLKQIKK